jgi:mycofactocin precursor
VAGITRFRKESRMNPEQNETVEADVTVEDLVEEVSIDGMCGVY